MMKIPSSFAILGLALFPAGLVTAGDPLVQTPGGLKPRSQVKEIRPGQVLREIGGRVAIVDLATGLVLDSLRSANRPRSITSTSVNDNGWITYSMWTAPSDNAIKQFITSWKVPQPPRKQDQQLIYLFNGLEDVAGSKILQPVLQWGESPAGGGNSWEIASWFVGSDGSAYHTPLVQVQPGELLNGRMALTSSSNAGYSYVSEFVGIPGTSLTIQNTEPLPVAAETLEAYQVVDCSEYPTDFTAFTGIGFDLATPASTVPWSAVNDVADCGQHTVIQETSSENGEVDLYFSDPTASSVPVEPTDSAARPRAEPLALLDRS